MTQRAKTRLKIWLVVLGIFILGGVTGAAIDSVYRLKASGGRAAEMRGPGRTLEKMKSERQEKLLRRWMVCRWR